MKNILEIIRETDFHKVGMTTNNEDGYNIFFKNQENSYIIIHMSNKDEIIGVSGIDGISGKILDINEMWEVSDWK